MSPKTEIASRCCSYFSDADISKNLYVGYISAATSRIEGKLKFIRSSCPAIYGLAKA